MGGENLEGSARVDPASASPAQPRNPTSDLHVTLVNDFKELNLAADDGDDGPDGSSVARPILGVIVATAVLYFGKDILLPLAMASILAVGFSPITSRLETLVGRFASAALVVVLAISTIGAIGVFLTVELTSVAVELAGYSNNIAAKLARLQGGTPAWLQTIEDGVKDVERRLQKVGPGPTEAPLQMVQAQAAPPAVFEVLKPVWPILSGFGQGLLVIVLLFFLLYARRDLRDRLVRLAARARIPVAAHAIETATGAVGRYLLLLSLTNLGFGIAIAIAAWLLGLPHAAFWGALTFVLRFIPYVGALSAAVLPTLVAFALFPGWSRSFAMLGCFLILDQTANQFVEPFLIGRGIGVSPVALLVSAMYWSWLWGYRGCCLRHRWRPV